MLRLLRNNSPFTVLILLIFTLVVKLQALLHPQLPAPLRGNFVYNGMLNGISKVLGGNAFAYTMLAVVLIFIQSLYISGIASRHKLFGRPGYVPAFTYLLLTSVYPPLSYFSLTLLVTSCMLPALDMLLDFNQTFQPRKLLYNAGFVLCLAALLQFSALIYFLFFLICLVILRPFNLGEWSVAMMGYITPLYFFAGILFLVDAFSLLPDWVHLGFSFPHTITHLLYTSGLLFGIVIMVVGGLFIMQQHLPRLSIYIRRNWLAIIFFLLASVFVAICTDAEVSAGWLIAMPALTLIISYALSVEKSKRFSNFIFYFSLAFIAFCQLTINK